MLAWTYQKEIIAGPPAGISGFFGLKMPRRHPLTAENKVSLNQFAKCLACDFEIGKSTLRIQLQTSESAQKNVRFKGGIFKLQTWAAKEFSLWTNVEDPPVRIHAGENTLLFEILSNQPLNLITDEKNVEIFVTKIEPTVRSPD